MSHIEVISISDDFRLLLSPEEVAVYPPEIEQHVETIWKEVTEITDWDLFDGKVFQLIELHPDHMTGVFNDYRYFFAQNMYPELKDELNLTLVGVAGILECEGKYLLGKRSEQVTQFPLAWEFAPSGGISIDYLTGENVEYEKQLFDELTHEVGMAWEFVTEIKPFMLVWDKQDQILDICAHLKVDPLGMASASYQSDEYIAYEWLPKDQIAEFLQGKKIVPMTSACLSYLF